METPTQENQQEFFPDFVKPSERKAEPRVPGAGRTHKPILFTTTIEQILFAAIVAILVLCAVYFLGILRGKSLAGRPAAARAVDALRTPLQAPAAPRPVLPRPAVSSLPPAARNAPAAPAPPVPVERRAIPATNVPAPAAQAPAAPAAGKRLYTIQIVTHKKRSFAETELAAIGKAGFTGKIVESDGYFIVCVGQYASKDDAKKDLSFLKTKYADCFLRRL